MPKGADKTTQRGKKHDQISSCATDGASTRNSYCATRIYPQKFSDALIQHITRRLLILAIYPQ